MSHVNPFSDHTCFDNSYLFLLPGNIIRDADNSEAHTFQLIYIVFTAID